MTMENGLAIALAAAIAVAGWRWWMRSRAAAEGEARLRRICLGDDSQVERLIAGERRRAGGSLSRAEAARRAIARHRRDNR
jgi:hypothetical protein